MGKTYIDKRGYFRFIINDMLVSRWIASLKIGRPLRSWEVVHHKNRNKLDNRPQNLWVCPQYIHEMFHKLDGDLYKNYFY